MKRAALVAAAIAVALPTFGALSTAQAVVLSSTPENHHETVRHNRHNVAHRAEIVTRNNRESPREERKHLGTGGAKSVDPKFLGMNAGVGLPSSGPVGARPPSSDWDCNNGDSGCSWEPHGSVGPGS